MDSNEVIYLVREKDSNNHGGPGINSEYGQHIYTDGSINLAKPANRSKVPGAHPNNQELIPAGSPAK